MQYIKSFLAPEDKKTTPKNWICGLMLTKMSVLKISPPAIPISSLEPVILVEGQSYRKAALCRSVARPPPRLSWDTDLNGQSTNRSLDNGVVTSHYSLHPLRAMNGKKLDCLVWHPTSPTPRRLRNKLEVHCEYWSEVYWANSEIDLQREWEHEEIKKKNLSTSCFNQCQYLHKRGRKSYIFHIYSSCWM